MSAGMKGLEIDALDVVREFVDMADGAEFESLGLKSVAICQSEIDAIRLTADRIATLEASLADQRDENARWLSRMADVREASGLGTTPMLSEIPDALRALRDRAATLEDEVVDLKTTVRTLVACSNDYLASGSELAKLCKEEDWRDSIDRAALAAGEG